MWHRVKNVGIFILGPVIMIGVLLAVAFLVRGTVWISERALPWLIDGSLIALGICVLILLPLCIFRKTRPWAGLGFYFASFLFGAMLFAFSCIMAVQIWGYFALAVGLVFAGVGVVPVAFVAALFHGEWPVLGVLMAGIILTFGTRALGIRLSTTPPTEYGEPAPLEGEIVS